MRGFTERDFFINLKKQRRRRRIAVFSVLFVTLSVTSFCAVKIFEMDAWSALDMDKVLLVDRSLIVLDESGAEYTTLHNTEDRIWVPLSDIPASVRNAFISAEDARFYDHFGVDVVRILGAAWADIKAGGYVQGASTISQQLIKLSHLTAEKEMSRKLEEAILAYQMERLYSKDEILEMYLNYVYFGGGYYGIEAAARGYFGVHASELTVAESAQLAGILKSPARFAPHLNAEASLGRRNVVLGLMKEYGYLDEAAYQTAVREPVKLIHGENAEKRGYYVDLVLTDACYLLDVNMAELLSDGYTITTAMDADLQTYCEGLYADDALFPDGTNEGLESALVIVDVETGGVAALIGGRDTSGALLFNRATEIQRQPGSVIKPILVYAPALEYGYTAASMLLDDEIDFDGYTPSNSSGEYSGWVTMREAVTKSLNVPAVSVMAQVGVGRSKAFAAKLGIQFDRKDTRLALALGGFTYGVSPMQVSAAYATFARGGTYVNPSLILKITDRDGNTVYEYKPQPERVMSQGNAFILTSMLESVVKEGTGKHLGTLNIPIAAKTGTVGDIVGNRDIWMAAYNPAYAASIWIGYDDGRRMSAEDASGGTYPAELLRLIFQHIYEGRTAPDFTMPSSVVRYRIDSYTLGTEHVAVLATALTPETSSYTEYFVIGTEPDEYTSYWAAPRPPETIAVSLNDRDKPVVTFDAPSRDMIYRLYRENSVGKSVMLGEFSNVEGTVTFTDERLKKEGEYAYYVIPVHPQLLINEQNITGSASKKVYVTKK